jgi:hypothetical protein
VKDLAGLVCELVLLAAWLAGIVLATGFWSTLAAVALPPWAMYLVVERGMRAIGWA